MNIKDEGERYDEASLAMCKRLFKLRKEHFEGMIELAKEKDRKTVKEMILDLKHLSKLINDIQKELTCEDCRFLFKLQKIKTRPFKPQRYRVYCNLYLNRKGRAAMIKTNNISISSCSLALPNVLFEEEED